MSDTDTYPNSAEKDAIEAASEAYSLTGNECFVIVSRGALAFRFGPFTGLQAGEIMEQCAEEKIPFLMTMMCGTPFNWDLARDLRGYPPDVAAAMDKAEEERK